MGDLTAAALEHQDLTPRELKDIYWAHFSLWERDIDLKKEEGNEWIVLARASHEGDDDDALDLDFN